MSENSNHLGRKIEKLRKIKGMNQDALAEILGISRQMISKIEQSETVEDERLEQIAAALGVSSDIIKKFNEDSSINYVQNYYDTSSSNNSGLFHCQFNPIDEYKKLVDENRKLYDQLLKSEREKVEILKSLLENK